MVAWTIESQTVEHWLCRSGQTPGLASDQSAYWSELFGLWGIFKSLYQLTKEYQIQSGSIVVACDGLSALKKASKEWITDPQEVHYNLISAIRKLRQQPPLKVHFQHVKGHQDCGQITVLPHIAWMNIEMDGVAKAAVAQDNSLDQTMVILYEGCVCSIKGHQVIKHFTVVLWQHLNGPIILNHWAMKQRFQLGMDKQIDWEMAEKAMLALPKPKQRWVTKMAMNFFPHGKNMTHWKLQTKATCPRCSCPVEDKDHIIRCPTESTLQKWNKALMELDNWMEVLKPTCSYAKTSCRVYNNGMMEYLQAQWMSQRQDNVNRP